MRSPTHNALSALPGLLCLLLGSWLEVGLVWADETSARCQPVVRLAADSRRASPSSATPQLGVGSDSSVVHRAPPPSVDPIAAEIARRRALVEYQRGRYRAALEGLAGLDPDDPSVMYQRSLALLGLGRVEEARAELQTLASLRGTTAEVLLDLALAELALGRPTQASATLREYVQSNPQDSYGRHLQRFAQATTSRQSEAPSRFEPAVELVDFVTTDADARGCVAENASATDVYQPLESFTLRTNPRAVAANYSGVLGAGLGVDPARRWNLTFLTAYEYDSNVPAAPSFSGLGSNFEREDSRALTALFGELRVVQNAFMTAGLLGTAFGNFHFDLTEFNLQTYAGGFFTNVRGGPWIADFHYQFFENLLDNKELIQEHRMTPNVSLLQGAFGHLAGFYEFTTAGLNGLALVPAQIRDERVHAVGITQAVYTFAGRGRIYAGYRFEEAFAKGSDFDRVTHQVNARLEMPICCRVLGNLDVRHYWDDFRHPNSLDFFDRPRFDQRTEVRVGIQRFATRHWSQRIDYTFVNNDSNVTNLFGVQFYEFARHILSCQLVYDF